MLQHELRHVRYRDVLAAIHALPSGRIFWGAVLVLLNYLVLTGYDQLAFRYIGKRVSGARVALASFVSYAISNNIGFALITGTSVRYRFYSRWGVSAGELSHIIVFYSSAFWLGLLALGGWSMAFHPHPALRHLVEVDALRVLGIVLLLIPLSYLALSFLRREAISVRGFELEVPGPRLALLQFVLSAIDWALAAAVLYALLPEGGPTFGALLGAFLAAQLVGLVSHVPGGVGVFESVMLVSLRGFYQQEQILSSLLLYRILYYLLPLVIALVVLVADEVHLRRHHIARFGSAVGSMTAQVAPRLLALFTFGAGVVLLVSGATPADPERLRVLGQYLPLAVFEASHFLGSVLAVALLILSQGIARRLDVAYYLAVIGLGLGIAFSLLKGGDYEEAVLLALLLLAFLNSREQFDRRAAFFDARFSPEWTLAAVAALGASIWLGFFAYKHVEYGGELWWRFALNRDVSRFLRGSVGSTVALLAFGIARMVRPAAAEVEPPSEELLRAAGNVLARQPYTTACLVYLRDKGVVFDPEQTSFVMYGVQGRTWVSMGDPVGPIERAPGMIRQFLERADDFGAVPVFYQVRSERLHMYADFGLTFAKLGEEARVRLTAFTLEGASNRGLRGTYNRLERDGARFRMLAGDEVRAHMAELRAVSEDWMRHKGASEKGFSLGFFDEDYIARLPVGVMTVDERIVAFANIWSTDEREEISVDLMRFREDAPKSVMDGLFLHLMLWAKTAGYQWFSLGMAPLSGLEVGPLAKAWARIGTFVYRHGEAFYNFQGVRAYKEKFHPVWEPRYLAYPGGLGLPRVLADVTALVAGGYRRILR